VIDIVRQIAAALLFLSGIAALSALLCLPLAFPYRRQSLSSLANPFARVLATVARMLRPALLVAVAMIAVLLVLQLISPARG
jgi:hypothetical protein